jgi:hypothetical protein
VGYAWGYALFVSSVIPQRARAVSVGCGRYGIGLLGCGQMGVCGLGHCGVVYLGVLRGIFRKQLLVRLLY